MSTAVLDPEEQGTFAQFNTDGSMVSPSRLSFSSISTLGECGELWRLTRGFKQGSNSYWANVGGSTVHEMTEHHDLGNVDCGTFEEVFAKHEARYEYDGLELVASGKKGLDEMSFAGGPNGKDRDWWLLYGPQMVWAYKVWRAEQRGEYEILDVEMSFEVVIGDELLVGHIDRLEHHIPSGSVVIRDIKTGVSGGYVQLSMYREGLRLATGGLIVADLGDLIKFETRKEKQLVPELDDEGNPKFYTRNTKTAAKGDPKYVEKTVELGVVCYSGRPTDFTGHTSEFIETMVRNARKTIEAGAFLPNLRNNCNYCGVRDYCRAYGGSEALMYPVATKITSGKKLLPVVGVSNG